GADTLDYSQLAAHSIPYHVDLVGGTATDVSAGISGFAAVSPDNLVGTFNPQDPPLGTPGDQQGIVFQPVTVPIPINIDPSLGTLVVTASPAVPEAPGQVAITAVGLPYGLTLGLNAITGQVSVIGVPKVAGSYVVTVDLYDSAGDSRSVTFAWNVEHV